MRGRELARRSRKTFRTEPSQSRGPDRSTKRDTTVSESATTEIPLPGLETLEPVAPDERAGRWLERGPSGKLMLFSGRSNPDLAEEIGELLGIQLGDVQLKTFAN